MQNLWQVCSQVSCISFMTLFLELLLSRIFMFMLGYLGAFIAIPLALLGLAIGSLYYQVRHNKKDLSIPTWILGFVMVTLFNFICLFELNNTLLPVVFDVKIMAAKALLFGVLFLASFFISGVVLSSLFQKNSEKIGHLYFFDFAGGAAACLLMPVLLHFFDIAVVISILLCAGLVACGLMTRRIFISGVAVGILILLVNLGILFPERIDYHAFFDGGKQKIFVEVQKKWNEYSRVAMVKISDKKTNRFIRYAIVHDNGISKALVVSPKTARTQIKNKQINIFRSEYIPKALGMEPKNILVLFAGCGNDMIYLSELHGEATDITGIELNPLVKSFCSDSPAVKDLGLKEYYSRPNFHLLISEGRNFLQANPHKKYDVIFVSRDGSSMVNLKQMFTAKYLQTAEAYKEYTRHLSDNGIVIFASDPGRQYRLNPQRIASLKEVHLGAGRRQFERSVFVQNGFLVYKPSLFTDKEFRALAATFGNNSNQHVRALIRGALDKKDIMTDDRPFQQRKTLESLWNFSDGHIGKILRTLTMGFLLFSSLLMILLLPYFTKELPQLLFYEKAYFLLTGFAYMCLQIGLISRYDLFLGNPLYSMAIIITAFLAWNGLGSFVSHHMKQKFSAKKIIFYVLIVTPLTIQFTNLCVTYGLSFPLFQKILISLAGLLPVGFLLGMLFPRGVALLNERNVKAAVPTAYTLSVLSSVLGSAYSLYILPNVGYNAVMLHAVPLYAAAIAILYRRA